MKNTLTKLLTALVIFTLVGSLFVPSQQALAKKKAKGLSEEEVTSVTNTVNSLYKKVYASALFSPQDNEKLIDIKIKLDSAMEAKPDPMYATLYYKLGYIYNQREYRDDAVDCYQVILDSFPETPYASRAINELKKMGVKIAAPTAQ